MKKMAILTMAVILLVAATVSAQLVVFADANLKAAVEGELGVSNPTPKHMLGLTFLNAGGMGIADLTGLEYGVNLTTLHLWDNQIIDISPLSGLTNLTYLSIGNNQISDISPISGLTNLTTLYLWINQISNISPLSGLTNLTTLSLDINQITDISPVSGLTNLIHLDLWDNQIIDISPLSGLTNLTYLAIGTNPISDISPISGLTNFTFLNLIANPLNCDAYRSVIPSIITNNPGIDIRYDPEPPGCPTAIVIDIKPGTDPNPINQGSNALVPVAILSSPEFDATQVDPTSVSLAGATVAVSGKGKSKAHEEDVNGDGLVDLVVQVETTGLDDLGVGGTVKLTGTTFGGEDIVGYDDVIIVPPDK